MAPRPYRSILPNARRSEQPVPKIEFGFGKSCVAADDLGGYGRGTGERIQILSELFTELITGRQRQGLGYLKIVLPFDTITRRVDF